MDWSLFSTLLPNISASEITSRIFAIAIILLLGAAAEQSLIIITRVVKRRLVAQSEGNKRDRLKRANSLATVLMASLSIVIWVVVVLAILQQLGVDIGPFLASAGILGLAISFGSQELVRDVISGLFILLENQFNEGDIVDIGGKQGEVVSMSLRTITLKDDENKAVYIIRNSQIGVLTRFTPTEEAESAHAKV